jgi:hypothetical protein
VGGVVVEVVCVSIGEVPDGYEALVSPMASLGALMGLEGSN